MVVEFNKKEEIVENFVWCPSFIKIYIAPLQGYYSEVLPILAQLK